MRLGGFGIVSWKATIKEMKTFRFYKDVLCEGFLTLIFMTFVTQSTMNLRGASTGAFEGSLVGLVVVALIESYGHINLALFNPNLVIGLVFSQRLSVPKGILYIAVEIGVATGAAKFIYTITPEIYRVGFGPPGPFPGIDDGQAWVCEFIAVMFFVGVLLGAIDEKRKTVRIPNLAIGLCVASAGTIGGPYGVALNPIVSFGLSYAADSWDKSWIYWTAGPAGAIVATVLYYFFAYDEGTCAKPEPEEDYDDMELIKGKTNAAYESDSNISAIRTFNHIDSQLGF